MLNAILKWSIIQRWIVVLGAIVVTIWGTYNLTQMPLDVFPDFAPPQVEIQTEAPGLAPEEVETLITLPIESAVNGTPGVETVRSSSAVSISVVKVIFKWGTDVYQARQLVTERLQQVQQKLPEGVENPQISPISSPIGTVLQYAFTAETTPLMEVRRLVDQDVTNRLLAVPGISQVIAYGGDIRQYQILVDPAKLKAFNVTLDEVTAAAKGANVNAAGGFLVNPDQELIIRGLGRIESIEQLGKSAITARNGTPVLLQDVADVSIGAALKRGDGSLNGQPAIVVMVNKQPQNDTPTVTKAVEKAIAEIKVGLPKDVKVTETFRQENFIEAAIENVTSSLRDGIIIVSIILLMFLMNWRTAIITLSAIPLSVLIGMMILGLFGQGINTMTLGGLAVAIGSVVDDSIVDMENCYRGLRKNQVASNPVHPFKVVYDTSVEVRVSVIFSTVIIGVVFAPIFTLTGVEGRIFAPMGVAYLVSIFASTLVAMTLSPALCAILLANRQLPADDTWISALSQRIYRPLVNFSIRFPTIILVVAGASLVASLVILPSLGRVFLPEFQEPSLVNTVLLYPGSSLEATNQVGFALEDALKDDKRFKTVQLRAGRAAGDADAGGVNLGHLDVELSAEGLKDREGSIEKLREEFAKIPGVAPNIGGFISHRMDEVLSGVRSAIAVKIFGPDLAQLRHIGSEVQSAMTGINGLVDLQLEPQVPIRQVQIQFNREAAARYGLTVGNLTEMVETALNGQVVSQVLKDQQLFDLVVWLQLKSRNNLDIIRNLLVDTPTGQKIPLAQVASIDYGTGPNTINRENVSRLIVVSANVSGRDLGSAVEEIQSKVRETVQLPTGYFIQYGGQFESEQRATQNLLVFGGLALVIIAVLMYFAVKSVAAMLMIMINLPLALVGGIFSIALGGGIISVASLVGFITLFGVATRNGLLLVDNYNGKIAQEMPLQQVIFEGSMERLVAILMTALTSALGMIPLVIGTGAGKEILQPLAVVVLGGLFTSTALTLMVLPALYAKFGKFLLPKRTISVVEDGKVPKAVFEQ
ncbi:CusA/CzcA family heavy metal efflux RND transporter (plasmid) [Anabaena sp. FACHB-709]|uniref:Cation efflux system protein n=2 Tax=Nostocaceae TaxID=1162 RepID=A0A1Z4KVY4_ANAVA|nr:MULTISPECIES: CusA/CzcA family heavy metal efflux RND transporter [Nostocaceae]BAY73087.1 cation efflux system protein [Trichormus variabilis NIES-23]HBW31232.1 CusA/CzcA family heavy metal efflux RND transporter [Nostoc sp. UBA8866]MBD2172973.1 CusA/CzcA family heavy metal efflux RND transporter [Anabaena cylindrica FACHB-318]MBD2264714.1 CusA/CzcA family heavy metal efflux RND transporter [Anabaena sp. FACHB-709]MBD2273937.1 CusA/CzcA family heavy metal efflux RND transporter [Nostoc sp. 